MDRDSLCRLIEAALKYPAPCDDCKWYDDCAMFNIACLDFYEYSCPRYEQAYKFARKETSRIREILKTDNEAIIRRFPVQAFYDRIYSETDD